MQARGYWGNQEKPVLGVLSHPERHSDRTSYHCSCTRERLQIVPKRLGRKEEGKDIDKLREEAF